MKTLKLKYSWGNNHYEVDEKIEDAEWEAMSENEQDAYAQELLDDYQGNCGFEAWYEVEDE